MAISKLAMISFGLSISPIIVFILSPIIGESLQVNSYAGKLTLTFLILPLISIHSIILARLSANYMKEYKLKGSAIAMSAIIIASLTFFFAIFKIATISI